MMNQRIVVLLEVVLTFVLILVQLWFVGIVLSPFIILPLGIVLTSWILRKDSWQTFGLSHIGIKNSRSLWRFLVGGIIVLFVVGGYIRFIYSHSFHLVLFQLIALLQGIVLRFIAYLVPALCQQIVLNSYFVKRIQFLTHKSKSTIIITGILFSLVHLPNPVLSVLTLVWGTISAHFFLKHRNIYPLVLVHASLAAIAYCVLPQALHHEFRVGMQFYLYSPSPCEGCVPEFLR